MTKIEELALLISRNTNREGPQSTAIPGLYLTRSSTKNLPRQEMSHACLCVVAQGAKRVLADKERFVYTPSTYLLASLGVPAVSEIIEASRSKPLLGMTLLLDFSEIAALMTEAGLPPQRHRGGQTFAVHEMEDDLLDPLLRYISLLTKREQIPILAPLIRREIFYKLLLSNQGGLLRQMTGETSKFHRIAKGLAWLRQNTTRSIRVEELATEVGMSPASMHQWFRSVTSMSPVQFHKQLRLQNARNIMLSECIDAARASRRVGYESPSQFSREYRRLFGAPPMQDVERLRTINRPN